MLYSQKRSLRTFTDIVTVSKHPEGGHFFFHVQAFSPLEDLLELLTFTGLGSIYKALIRKTNYRSSNL